MKLPFRIFSVSGKSLLLGCLLSSLGNPSLRAQNSAVPAEPPIATLLSEEQLLELLGPVALYPDALIALILPASTVPADVALAARYLEAGRDAGQLDSQPWDDSVKALARYPEIVAWMNENLEWTNALGDAFIAQPADVMNAIQTLRARAQAAGNLADTTQQVVVTEGPIIRILPADPTVIYVPQYDPQIVFVRAYSPAPLISFGLGFGVGAWLSFDCDWRRRCLYRGPWRGWTGWTQRPPSVGYPNRDVNVINIDAEGARPWQPSPRGVRAFERHQKNATATPRFVSPQVIPPTRPQIPPSAKPEPTRKNPRLPATNPPTINPPARQIEPRRTPSTVSPPVRLPANTGELPRRPNPSPREDRSKTPDSRIQPILTPQLPTPQQRDPRRQSPPQPSPQRQREPVRSPEISIPERQTPKEAPVHESQRPPRSAPSAPQPRPQQPAPQRSQPLSPGTQPASPTRSNSPRTEAPLRQFQQQNEPPARSRGEEKRKN